MHPDPLIFDFSSTSSRVVVLSSEKLAGPVRARHPTQGLMGTQLAKPVVKSSVMELSIPRCTNWYPTQLPCLFSWSYSALLHESNGQRQNRRLNGESLSALVLMEPSQDVSTNPRSPHILVRSSVTCVSFPVWDGSLRPFSPKWRQTQPSRGPRAVHAYGPADVADTGDLRMLLCEIDFSGSEPWKAFRRRVFGERANFVALVSLPVSSPTV